MTRKRVRNRGAASGEPYSSALVRRKKREVQTLRLEADALAAQLSELRQRQVPDVQTSAALVEFQSSTAANSTRWRRVACVEGEQRRRAERTNRELRVVLGEQQQLRARLLKTLQKALPPQDVDFVLRPRRGVHRAPRELSSFSDTVLEEMCSQVDWLRLDTDEVFPVVESGTTVSFRWQVMPGGNCIESSSVTPVARSAQTVGDMLWQYTTNSKKGKGALFHSVQRNFVELQDRRSTPSAFDVNILSSLLEGSRCTNSITTYRRYDEGDRVVMVGITKLFLSTGEFVSEDCNWTVVSASPEDPQRACVIKNFYKSEMASDVPAHAAPAQSIVFEAMIGKMRSFRQSMQDNLLTNF